MNVNGHRSDNDEFDDESWTPPTEAEQKVIEARRERNNKISSLMGQYLLKGYKMLAITCQLCDVSKNYLLHALTVLGYA